MNFFNRPNFQVTAREDGQRYWISRSVAVVVVPLFFCEGLTYVPLGRRSPLMSLYPGSWGLPGGFLDWGESAREAVCRETWEEVGLDLLKYGAIHPNPASVCSEPDPAECETVTLRFVFRAGVDELPPLTPGEEVTEVMWKEISQEIETPGWQEFKMAFNHKKLIERALRL